jgi:hypothetical protein
LNVADKQAGSKKEKRPMDLWTTQERALTTTPQAPHQQRFNFPFFEEERDVKRDYSAICSDLSRKTVGTGSFDAARWSVPLAFGGDSSRNTVT